MNRVFLDTVGLLALWDESDQWHAQAEAAFEKLLQRNAVLMTTGPILLECGNAAARRPYRSTVARLRLGMEAAGLLVHPTSDDWDTAWVAYEKGAAGNAGIVDHLSFVVMRRLEIHDAFTNDSHFRAAGFTTLF